MTKLLTEAAKKALPLLDSSSKAADPTKIPILIRFKADWVDWEWFVTEGREEPDGDWTFFGVKVAEYGRECGYFTLGELVALAGPNGEKVERDTGYGGHFLSEALR